MKINVNKHMKSYWYAYFYIFFMALIASQAFGQTQPTVRQSGTITAGDLAVWKNNQVIQDGASGGGAGGATVSSPLNITGNSPFININGVQALGYPGDTGSVALGAGAISTTTTNIQSAAVGFQALKSVTTGVNNNAFGWNAGANITIGKWNNYFGHDAGTANISGIDNTGIGEGALFLATSGENTALGAGALIALTTGTQNVVVGASTITATVGSSFMTVVGQAAGGGTNDTCIGQGACNATNVDSNQNTALGFHALTATTSGGANVAIGGGALAQDLIGVQNVAVGASALNGQKAGFSVAVGYQACLTCWANNNTVVGYQALSTANESGANNTVLGMQVASTTLVSGSNNILIGYSNAVDTLAATTTNELNIGNTIYQNTGGGATNPVVSACGTGSPTTDTHGNNKSGTVTAGGGALASCTITFAAGGYVSWNHCRVTFHNETLAGAGYSYTKTVLTVTATSLTAAVFDYDCDGV